MQGNAANERELHRIVRQVLPAGLDADPCGRAFVAVDAIELAGIRRGDVVFVAQDPYISRSTRRAIRGSVHRIPRDAYGAILDAADALHYAGGTWDGDRRTCLEREQQKGLQTIRAGWRRHCDGRSWNPATAKVWILRPWRVVSAPVQASSDEAAIFTLLRDAGGRLDPAR